MYTLRLQIYTLSTPYYAKNAVFCLKKIKSTIPSGWYLMLLYPNWMEADLSGIPQLLGRLGHPQVSFP